MANVNILGAIGAQDSDYVALHTYGQGVIYDALKGILGDHNADMAMVQEVFVEASTWKHADKYKLPGNGRLQRRGVQSRNAEVKAVGEWSVGYPIEDFGAGVKIDRISWAYMTAPEFNRQVETVIRQDTNTYRFELLRALFNNTARTFTDPYWPAITVQPLANGDTIVYPPIIGAESNATQNNYLGVAAAATTFTDVTNPIPTIVNQLEQNFGTPTGGSEIVLFVNNAQTASVQNLAGFDTVPNRFVTYGQNVSLVEAGDRPPFLPGRVLGESDSALIVEWRWIPANYIVGIHLGAPKPLMKRVDTPESGLASGLQIVAEDFENPFLAYEWCNRYGIGVGNRLNGVVMDLATGGSAYTIPTAYA